MRVAIDMQLALGTATGIGEYVRGLSRALQSRGVDVVSLADPGLDPWRFDRRVRWDQLILPRRARASGADLLHCASGTMPLRAPLPVAVTVHDVAWLKVQRHARPYARWYFGAFMLQRYLRAAAIAVDSAFSRRELLEVLNVPKERVRVVYPGVADDFCAQQRTPSNQRVIFVPGTVERRKNLEVVIRALPALADARVVCVGPPTPYQSACERLAQEVGVRDRVTFRGYVPRETLLDFYARCTLVAVPSTYEGFGYAAAQALCAGAPVLVSDRSSLPEVVQTAAPIVPANDVAAWTAAIKAIFEDESKANAHAASQRASAISRFSWSTCASHMLSVYEFALQGHT